MTLKSRKKIPVSDIQYRLKRPDTTKILFISCEGLVTEETYFKILSEKIFNNIKTKIQIISVREDFNSIEPKSRIQEDIDMQNKSTPSQVTERINDFVSKKQSIYLFDQNPDDEFWLVIDIDEHTDKNHIKEWESVLNECKAKKYNCAISNPFFEFWLYLHHLDVEEKAYTYAVTNTHSYEKTNYFLDKIRSIDIKMTGNNNKKPCADDYSREKVDKAVNQAKGLHINKQESWPSSLGSTVYLLVQKMTEMSN